MADGRAADKTKWQIVADEAIGGIRHYAIWIVAGEVNGGISYRVAWIMAGKRRSQRRGNLDRSL